ncbi:MAG: 2-oxoacid:ferredoxin oxidoreductase subunit beta [Candidatus Bathyarchaeota archaeon]|nr:MAG: 2-oxoacid:ferredoxin oxidoreductase subunit beta [Candidatus Bathyarchaeota archaeon]
MPAKPLSYYRDKYIRNQPSAFCVGCGNGTILNCFTRAVDDLEIPPEKILCVSGIGCSAWIPSPNFNGDTLHTTHGRALAFATGAKAFNSDLTTVVFTGDGDGAGIGGNHLIHAARRNIDITTILVNNLSYAMTGGQIAPTTHRGERTVTSPYGNPENPFDMTRLAAAAGATYVARWTTWHVLELTRSIKEALQHPGFAFIEVLSQCPIQQRRMFGMQDPIHRLPNRILEMFEESTYIRKRPEPMGYRYAVPKEFPDKAFEKINEALRRYEASTRIVDHMELGRVVKIEAEEDEDVWGALANLEAVERISGPLEGKIELGLFVKEERPEFTDTLRRIIRDSGGR